MCEEIFVENFSLPERILLIVPVMDCMFSVCVKEDVLVISVNALSD